MAEGQMAVCIEHIMKVQDVAPVYRLAVVGLKKLGVSHGCRISEANKLRFSAGIIRS